MATIAPAQSADSASFLEWIPPHLFRMSLGQYEALVASGAFNEHDRLHLINGFLVERMTQGDPHCVADDLCRNALVSALPTGWFVRSNKPVRLPPHSKPEPDHAVVRGQIRDYLHQSPGPADVALIVEIAFSSLRDDREMARLYSQAGISTYWIVNLIDRQVEVYSDPTGTGYASYVCYSVGQIVPVVIAGVQAGSVAVADIFP